MKEKIKAYKRSIPIFGIITLLYVLNEYERAENYRECSYIHTAIKQHNEHFTDIDKLPTHLSQINPKEYLKEHGAKMGVEEFNPLKDINNYIQQLKNYVK